MIVSLIPARGGSKGIPRKNIKMIAGKPLMVWSIEHSLNCSLIDKTIVSTEDDEIAEVARKAGAEVLMRPAELATDTASTLAVLQHAVEMIPCDTIVLLQATSPIRSKNLVSDCIKEFQAVGADSLATGFYCNYLEYGSNTKRRQEIDGFFYDDGNVYVINAEQVSKGERYGKNQVRKVVSREESVDVDEEFDFWLAEKVLTERV